MHIAAVAVAVVAAGCRLGPLVDDVPGASANILPPGAMVPLVTTNPDLVTQIALNDGLDDATLTASGGVIPRATGLSGGVPVHYWSFGAANRAPSPLYVFVTADGAEVDHPGLVDALPGDAGYSPIHSLIQVVVTPAYKGERIPTAAALADAIELGLVEEPKLLGTFVASPIVLPGITLDVGAAGPAQPIPVYGAGYAVAMFRFGGSRGIQPLARLVPARQVSFLRGPQQPGYDATRPIFQATIPSAPATTTLTYTPLSIVVNVDVNTPATDFVQDGDLFMRSDTGAITMTKPDVTQFLVTTTTLFLQLQFMDGQP